MKTQSKYRNVATFVDGIRFDSKAESQRYKQLKLLEKAGKISRLKLQTTFKLHGGITYKADFTYFEFSSNKLVAEDVKGVETEAFKLKKRLFEADCPGWDLRVIPAKEV